MAPAHEGRTASKLDKFPQQKQQKSQKGCASVMDRPTHAGGGAAKARKAQLTVTNLDAVSKVNGENNVTKNSSPNGPHRNSVCVPSQKRIEIESGFSTPQRTLTPQSSCTDLESASSHESSLRDVEPEVERQALPSWLQPAHANSAATGGVRASLRQRGRQIAATAASQQDNSTRTNLRARGRVVLEGVRAGMCNDASVVPAPLEHAKTQAAAMQYHNWLYSMQSQATAPAPMKVDMTSLASSGMSFPPGLEPPPGLEMPATLSL